MKRRPVIVALAAVLLPVAVLAQKAPNWPMGYIPSADEWRNSQASKLDMRGQDVDSSHTGADGGATANNLGVSAGTVDCPTSTQSSTSMLCIRARSGVGDPRQPYMVNLNLDGYPGATGDNVTLYAGYRGHPGSRPGWAFNTVSHYEPGSGGGNGVELDTNNWNCDAGDGNRVPAAAGCSFASPLIGLLVTGASPHPAGHAIEITGVSTANTQWHNGLTVTGNVVDFASIQTNTFAPYDYYLSGAHTDGINARTAFITDPAGALLHMSNGHTIRWDPRSNETGNAHWITSTANTLEMRNAVGPMLTLSDVSGATVARMTTAADAAVGTNLAVGGRTDMGGTLYMADAQNICWPGGNCLTFSSGKWLFFNGAGGSAVPVASINGTTGNMILKGTLQQNAAP